MQIPDATHSHDYTIKLFHSDKADTHKENGIHPQYIHQYTVYKVFLPVEC